MLKEPEIELRLVSGFGCGSGAIRLVSHGEFTHVDAVVPKGGIPNIEWPAGSLVGARSDRIGGKPSGLQCRPFGYERVHKAVRFHSPASELQVQGFWSFLYSQEEHKYDKPSILANVFNANWHAAGEYVCSAAICDALQSIDWLKPCYSPWWEIRPQELANMVSSRGATWEPDLA
jgi:hypothetical protein